MMISLPPVFAQQVTPAKKPPFRESHAILVGVNQYAELPKLDFSCDDVKALAECLTDAGFRPENVTVLHDSAAEALRPVKKNVETQILRTLAAAGPEDLVFLVFSGHGYTLGDKTFIAPQDAKSPKNEMDTAAKNTLISLDWLHDAVRKSRAKTKLLFIDACRDGVVYVDESGRPLTGRTATRRRGAASVALPTPAGMLQLAACEVGEASFESEELRHSVYTYFLMEAIRGRADENRDGVLTLKEIAKYAGAKTQAFVREHFQATQRPSLKGNLTADIPLMICEHHAKLRFPEDVPIPLLRRGGGAADGMVFSSGGGNFARLDLAVSRLEDNGVLTISPGTYRITKPLIVDRNIKIVGAGKLPGDTQIVSSGKGCLIIRAESAEIENLRFQVNAGMRFPDPAVLEKMSEEQQEKFYRDADDYTAVVVAAGKSKINRCVISSDYADAVWVLGSTAAPAFSRCEMSASAGCGVKVSDQGKGTFTECEISGNLFSGVQVSQSGSPVFRNSAIFDGRNGGVLFCDQAKGILENCRIYGNALSGVEVCDGAKPTVRGCEITKNAESGIFIHEDGGGVYQKNTLSGNGSGDWNVEASAGSVVNEENVIRRR